MKSIAVLLFLFAGVASALQLLAPAKVYAPAVKLETLPTVYVYDHCPFCVRVRLALGLKNVKHEVRFLANDDIATPTNLVGKKVAPIWQETPGGDAMPESMDIIKKIDADAKYGAPLFKPATDRDDIKAWMKSVKADNGLLQRPRYMMSGILPEFQQRDARNAFVKNHPVFGVEKPVWKEEVSEEERWAKYAEAYKMSPELIEKANAALTKVDGMIYSPEHCTEGGLSLDDIDLWARLRSLTIVKGLVWPEKTRKYMEHFSAAGDVPLYDSVAC